MILTEDSILHDKNFYDDRGFPNVGKDGYIKWGFIESVLKHFNDNSGKFLVELGVGNSALPSLIADMNYQVTAIDKFNINSNVLKDYRVNSRIIDAKDYLINLPDHSIDYFVDSCAMIHFNPRHDFADNDGVWECVGLMSKKLKMGGSIIVASDIITPNDHDHNYLGEFISYENLINIYRKHGFTMMNTFNKSIDRYTFKYNDLNLSVDGLVFQL